MLEIKLQKIVGGILNKLQKTFSPTQVIENSRQYLLLQQIFYRKQSLSAPDNEVQRSKKNKYVRYDEVSF